jgi:hypothetical protein
MSPDRQLLNFIVEKDLLSRLDDFRFQNRFATRSGAIKWLLNWALTKDPALTDSAPEIAVPVTILKPEPVPEPIPFPAAAPVPPPMPAAQIAAVKPEPSHASVIAALRAQGYEIGETAVQDGQARLVVRSNDGSALVNVGQELHDLAAARLTLSDIAARRRHVR